MLSGLLTDSFSDIPYFNPIQCSAFYSAVSASHLHKLPSSKLFEQDISFFVEPKEKWNHDAQKLANWSQQWPQFFLPQNKKLGGCFSIREVDVDDAHTRDGQIEISFSLESVNRFWTDMIKLVTDQSDEPLHFVITTLDIVCFDGEMEFLLSLMLTGIASVFHQFPKAVSNASVEILVQSSREGKLLGDRIQYYVETNLQLRVNRLSCCTSNPPPVEKEEADSESDWVELIRSTVVEWHEDACDTMGTSSDAQPDVLLLILPSVQCTRELASKSILDSYCSEPLRVAYEDAWSLELLDNKAPLVFICSSTWIFGQSKLPFWDQVIRKLQIRKIIHGGFSEFDLDLTMEIHGVQRLSSIYPQLDAPLTLYKVSENENYFRNNSATPHFEFTHAFLLLLFRRFVSRDGRGSQYTFNRNMFISLEAWKYFRSLTSWMHLCGIVDDDRSADVDMAEVSLTVFGIFLSSELKIGCQTVSCCDEPNLSPVDKKIILWSVLLRLDKQDVIDVVQKRYLFTDHVAEKVDAFSKTYGIGFVQQSGGSRQNLVRLLSDTLSKDEGENSNRVHMLLGSPFGSRRQIHQTGEENVSTRCRGWYNRAFLHADYTVEQKEVPVYCPPSPSNYGELRIPTMSEDYTFQCPLELSYPIIVVRCVLHIAFHNNCVLLLSRPPTKLLQLPENLLESPVMRSILDGVSESNIGLWLDGVLNETKLVSVDPGILTSLHLKGGALVGLCKGSSFRKKRKRTEDATGAQTENTETFTGKKPKTVVERETIDDFIKAVHDIGKEKAESMFRKKKGFGFIDPSHELHPYYQFTLLKGNNAKTNK